MPAVTSAWAKVSTNATQFALQNTGLVVVLARLVATGGSAPTGLDGFKVQPNELFALSNLAGHDLYVSAPQGASAVHLYHDGS